MLEVIALTIIFALILYLQLPSIIKRNNIREIGAYSSLMLIGIIYTYGYVLDIELPNPTHAVDFVFRPVTELLNKLLGG
ncbi:hypothetical protein JCM14036_18210 [Desulfotomaculum defluvii]